MSINKETRRRFQRLLKIRRIHLARVIGAALGEIDKSGGLEAVVKGLAQKGLGERHGR